MGPGTAQSLRHHQLGGRLHNSALSSPPNATDRLILGVSRVSPPIVTVLPAGAGADFGHAGEARMQCMRLPWPPPAVVARPARQQGSGSRGSLPPTCFAACGVGQDIFGNRQRAGLQLAGAQGGSNARAQHRSCPHVCVQIYARVGPGRHHAPHPITKCCNSPKPTTVRLHVYQGSCIH